MSDSMGGRKRKPLSQLAHSHDTPSTVKKSRLDETKTERRAGTIIRMVLKNFMCHSLLEVDLTSNINILIGRNGSGKSAILTALVIGLGGKASTTNRGTNVHNFIKAGKKSSSIEIQLYNGGAMAYRPKVYGKKIVVVKNISTSGGSYKIKGENGDLISSSVKELYNITASLNIQVDNPISILNQNTSRDFLNSSNPKDKFTLFMKATKLDTLAEEYKNITVNKKTSVRIYEDRQSNFLKLKAQMKELQTKIENHNNMLGARERIETLQCELLWAKVKNAQKDFDEEETVVENFKRKLETLRNHSKNRSARIDGIKKEIEELNGKVAELEGTIQEQSQPQKAAERTISDLKLQYSTKKGERHLINTAIESKKRDLNVLATEIAKFNDNISKIEQEKIQRLRNLTNMRDRMNAMDEHLKTCLNDVYQISNDIAQKGEKKAMLKKEIDQLDYKIRNENSSINALEQESGNTLLFYGQDIPKVNNLIETNRNRFYKMPRGPLGSYIKLKDKKWAVAVEGFIGSGLLGCYVVDNAKDNKLLMQIFDQVWTTGQKPMIITTKFFNQPHDVRPNLVQAPPECESIYNVLDIEDPVVANCIVDQRAVEGMLLVPSNEMAVDLLSHSSRVPQNCQQGVTIKGDRYYPDPNYKTYGSRYHKACYLKVNTEEHISQLKQNVKNFMDKKRELEAQYNSIGREIREQEMQKVQLDEKVRKLNSAKSLVRRQLEELKDAAEPEVANIDLLQNEMVEIRNSIKEKEQQLIRIEESIKETKAAIGEKEESLGDLRNINNDLEERIRFIKSQINEKAVHQKEISTSDEFDKRKVQDGKNKLKDAQAELLTKQTTLTVFMQQASAVGERQETERTVKEIITDITELEKSIRKIEAEKVNPEDIVKKYDSMAQKLGAVSALLSSLNRDIDELNIAISKRSRHYKVTEEYFITFIKHSFKKIMEVRQFQGSITIDMLQKHLDLVVIPQHGSQGLTKTSNLSGGERSFSTVAFLYSLWQCMEFPFYFLDEFDVFMDKLNRTKVIEILIHHAETHPSLQFVFLTPQDISFVKSNVQILRLQDPERIPV